jgi:peroxiredoxin
MGQLRQDYQEFTRRGAEVIALGPDGPHAFQRFWEQHDMPFVGLADVKSRVADQYAQEVNLLKLGRMPALFVIDRSGRVRYVHYGEAMQDTAKNAEVLDILDQLNKEK